MQSEFEDNIKKKADGLGLQPSAHVWERVEAELPDKKRRRFAFWWWLPGLILLGGIGLFYLGRKHEQLSKDAFANSKTVIKIEEVKKKNIKEKGVEINTEQINKAPIISNNKVADIHKIKKENKTELQLRIDRNKNKQITKNKSPKEIKYENSNAFNSEKRLNNTVPFNEKKKITDKIQTDNYLNKSSVKSEKKNLNKINNGSSLDSNKRMANNIDSALIVDNKKDSLELKKDTAATIVKKIIKTNNTSKVNWELTASVGSSNTVGQAFSNGTSSNYAVANGSYSTNPTNPALPQASLSLPTAGVSFAIGMQRSQQISKKWAWYGSLQYAFLSNHQTSGALVDSSLLLTGQATLPNYYKYGNTIDHRNYVHRIDLSAGFKYTIKPNGNKPLSLYGGLMLGYQFSNNWLQADAIQPVLFSSDGLVTKLITGTRLGFDWQLAKQLSAGIFYEYSFTTASRSASQYYLHWQQVGIKLSIPFNLNKSQKNIPK